MSPSTPSSVSRYRPVVLIIVGAAAAYATYLVYTVSQAAPGDGLHRSNAVRRPNARRRRNASQTTRLNSRLDDVASAFGEYDLYGHQLSLSPHNLLSPIELEDAITLAHPDITAQERNHIVEDVYETFLNRLLALVTPNRPPSQVEMDAITRWVSDRHGNQVQLDSASVTRAVERYTETLQSAGIPAVDGAESVAPTELSWGSDDDTEGEANDANAQTLQRTLYHIAEDRARQEGVVHRGVTCNGCDEKPIRGIRWHCANCADFDLCSNCEATNSHLKTHIFYKIRVPAPYMGMAKQEPLYPGRPHMMSSSAPSTLKKRLVAETKMEAEAIDGLWDQFTCLAGTEWLADPNNVNWALDRRAFNHAFMPRYNSFVAAPSLIHDRIFAHYDSDKNGLIGFEEWIKGVDGMRTTNSQVKNRIIFNGYDIDGDGYISRKDILRVFRAYYALEKEATRDYIAEITEELSVRNALDTIHSSQPLGSVFPPHGLAAYDGTGLHPQQKAVDDFENTEPVLQDDNMDVADREEMLAAAGQHSGQNSAVTTRWARRQFYVDEEEGFTQPQGVEDDEASDDDDSASTGQQNEDTENHSDARPRWSRSSSRVRFQDDVEIETRSNASTSSRPVGERWGGYEIPEPEKDIGKEVLYQITQQSFNELLDPLFEDRENDAMDAYATRSERRKYAAQLEQTNDCFGTHSRQKFRSICKVGIFRYSRCITSLFCKALNDAHGYSSLRALFQNPDGTNIDRKEAKMRLQRIYAELEEFLLGTIIVPEDWETSDISLWNSWLCQNQLQYEMIRAALYCTSRQEWIPSAKSSRGDLSASTELTHRDPTMPQFRPNSSANLTPGEEFSTLNESSSTTDEDSDLGTFGTYNAMSDSITSKPSGPFFVYAPVTRGDEGLTRDHITREGTLTAQQFSESQSSDLMPASIDQAATSTHEHQSMEDRTIEWSDYKNDPVINLIEIDSSKQFQTVSRPVRHSQNPYISDRDQLKSLHRHVRQLAADATSKSHYILLASLEAVQREIHERKGSGLINFEEFEVHMQKDKLGFIGACMEWVCI
jgi:hypothetical protein